MQTNLIVYASGRTCRQRLLKAIHRQAALCALETHANIDTLRSSLRRFFQGPTWAILVTENRLELNEVIQMECLLHNMRIILILYNQDQETLMAGHTLYPRFISFLESDFRDVGSVLEKVIHNNQILTN